MALILRIVRAGLAAALVAGVAGFALERSRFGTSDDAAVAQAEAEVRRRFDASAATLRTIATRVAAVRSASATAPPDLAAIRRLFDDVAASLPPADAPPTGITIYDASGAPLAWAGRLSDVPRERIQGPEALIIAPGALGPRLLRVQPVLGAAAARTATVVVEQLLGTSRDAPGPVDTFTVPTSIGAVAVRVRPAGPAAADPLHFVVAVRDSAFRLEGDISAADLAARRQWWRSTTRAVVLGVLAVTLLLCIGPLIDMRHAARDSSRFVLLTALLIVTVIATRIVLFVALAPFAPQPQTSAYDLLLTSLTLAAVVGIVLDLIQRRRFAHPRVRVVTGGASAAVTLAVSYAAAACASGALMWAYERLLRRMVADTNIDLLHFSLHPLSARRIALEFALVLLHAAVVWAAVTILRIPPTIRRPSRTTAARLAIAGGWLAGVVAASMLVRMTTPDVPLAALYPPLVLAAVGAIGLSRLGPRMRHLSQTGRMAAFSLALLAPALAMYPLLLADATDTKERLVSTVFGPQAASLRQDLQQRLQHTVAQIDAMPALADFVGGTRAATPSTDPATIVWSQTDLAAYRLTSAVELYGVNGNLVSRFALSLPEYTDTTYVAAGCDWDQPFDEVSPFGSSERHVLRTGRGICINGHKVGGVAVRVMLDYRTLPFISSQSPYLESLRPKRRQAPEGVRDVEFAVYGWSRAPIFESGTRIWKLNDQVFARLVASRTPFWTDIDRDNRTFRLYLLSDRGSIYALGYPVIDGIGHLMNLAELGLLVGVFYLAARVMMLVFGALTMRTPASGRALLREIRSSFYRKLFLAFLAGALVPVAVLALFTRTYVQTQLNATAEEAAARTVTTAQRLVEDYAALQQRGAAALDTIDDQIMVLVRRAIDEDVNLFNGDRLQATSARDLFASQLLPLRTPADVYRAVVLDRLPTYVREEVVGSFRYSLAAAPVRSPGREGIVTVPLTNRQQEIEQQIDELDRLVLSGFMLFSLFGAALGYWMAERIADPVNRLTRATRRIARGDLDARIAATSSDELRRLVEDFNQMAADLKRQRSELERTQRLEAWADMARQVAHDIKNPLTPIQLSAEHAQRVNIDRGRPLSPVLDECVTAILGQVKLLRQISAEFSSFASSPTPRPEASDLAAVIESVIEPYRTGLAARIAIDVTADANLPTVTIDRTLFARALTNIIENGLHAMPGTGRLTIASRQLLVDGRPAIVVEITDTGVGMDDEALRKIFEPYFSTKATGTGLGLTIAKRNVELIGGTIAVRSERGIGTTVTITLPDQDVATIHDPARKN